MSSISSVLMSGGEMLQSLLPRVIMEMKLFKDEMGRVIAVSEVSGFRLILEYPPSSSG